MMGRAVLVLVLIPVLLAAIFVAYQWHSVTMGTVVHRGQFPNSEYVGVVRRHGKSVIMPSDGYYYTLQVLRGRRAITSFVVAKDSFIATSFSLAKQGDELAFELGGHTYFCRCDERSSNYYVWRSSTVDPVWLLRQYQPPPGKPGGGGP